MLNLKHYLGYDRLVAAFDDVHLDNHLIRGTLVLESKTGAELDYLFLKLVEHYSYGWWKGKQEKDLILADKVYKKKMTLVKNQVYKLRFSVPFQPQRSKLEQRAEEENVAGRFLAQVAQRIGNAQSSFYLIAEIKLVGSPVKSYLKEEIELK